MKEAAAAIIGFGFEELRAKRIQGCDALWNIGSQKNPAECGNEFHRIYSGGLFKKWGMGS